jgi:hypothetical protein
MTRSMLFVGIAVVLGGPGMAARWRLTPLLSEN